MSPGANPRRGISKSRARKPTSDVSPRRGARPKYSEKFRHKVVKYSIKNGIARAADRFEVSTPSVTNWRKLYGVTRKTKIRAEKGQKISLPKQPIPKQERRSTGRKYSAQFRREVAEFSVLEGVVSTAQRFGVSTPSVTNWRREFGINRSTKAKRARKNMQGNAAGRGMTRLQINAIKKKLVQSLRLIDQWIEKN